VHTDEIKNSFYQLNPELVLEATEAAGFHPTGEFSQLNSYENRVFDLRLESGDRDLSRVIGKFYRPGRWSIKALEEEHQFLLDLKEEGLTAVAPLRQKNGKTLCEVGGIFAAFFPKVLGRLPQEFLEADLEHVGKKLALLHNVGAQKKFRHRPVLMKSPQDPWETLEFLLPWVAAEVRRRYETAATELFHLCEDHIDPSSFQRIHGDCHRGNLLHNSKSGPDSEFFFVDFDDCMMGPVVQDVWMLFSSTEIDEEAKQLIQGYESLRLFPLDQLQWIPLLRGLRIVNYAAWIARRWRDPSFPRLFPLFEQYNYWAEEVEAVERIIWSFTKS